MKELVNVKVDKDLKSNCDELFDSLGLDTETAINIFSTASLHHMGIPFHIGFDDCECDCDCDCNCECDCNCDCDCNCNCKECECDCEKCDSHCEDSD